MKKAILTDISQRSIREHLAILELNLAFLDCFILFVVLL